MEKITLAKITKYNINWDDVEQIFFGKHNQRPWFTGHGDTPEEAIVMIEDNYKAHTNFLERWMDKLKF